jgi:hypothetical protein
MSKPTAAEKAVKAKAAADDKAKIAPLATEGNVTFVEDDKFKPENAKATAKRSITESVEHGNKKDKSLHDACISISILVALDKSGNNKVREALDLGNELYNKLGRSTRKGLYITWLKTYAALDWDKDNKKFDKVDPTKFKRVKDDYDKRRGEFFKVRFDNPPHKETEDSSAGGGGGDERKKDLRKEFKKTIDRFKAMKIAEDSEEDRKEIVEKLSKMQGTQSVEPYRDPLTEMKDRRDYYLAQIESGLLPPAYKPIVNLIKQAVDWVEQKLNEFEASQPVGDAPESEAPADDDNASEHDNDNAKSTVTAAAA